MGPARCRCEDREVHEVEQRAGLCARCDLPLTREAGREKAVVRPPETRGG